MSAPSTAAGLLDIVTTAQREDLLPLIRALDLARDAAIVRLLQPARLLTVDEAAELTGLAARRLRSLARGKPWALRLGTALRIDEAALLAWARCSRNAENGAPKTDSAGSRVQGAHKRARNRGQGALRPVAR